MPETTVPYIRIGSLTYDHKTINMIRDSVMTIRDDLAREDKKDHVLVLSHTAVILKFVLGTLDAPK